MSRETGWPCGHRHPSPGGSSRTGEGRSRLQVWSRELSARRRAPQLRLQLAGHARHERRRVRQSIQQRFADQAVVAFGMIGRHTAFVAPEDVASTPVDVSVCSQKFVHRSWRGAAGEGEIEDASLRDADKRGGRNHPGGSPGELCAIGLDDNVMIGGTFVPADIIALERAFLCSHCYLFAAVFAVPPTSCSLPCCLWLRILLV